MPSNPLKSPLFFCGLILVTYLIGLWGMSIPLTGDQKVYLSIALEMFEKKEWIIPSLFGEANFLKPPFQYWATILGWKLYGLSIFGALVPSLFALMGSAFLTFKIGEKLKLVSPAVAAVLFASTIGTVTYGTTAQMEIWIVFFMLAAWYSVLCSEVFTAFVLVGIMAWIKGPLYPVLWTMSLLLWNRKAIKEKSFWFSLVAGTVIGLSWYFLAAQTHRQEMMQQFFYTENLAKLSAPQGSVFSLWGEFFFSLFPWCFLVILAAFQSETREKWKQNQKFYLSYAMVPAFFFTVFPYRVNSYLYFLTPLLAMMVAEMDLSLAPRIKKIILGIYGVFFTLLAVFIYRMWQGDWISPEILVSCVLAILVFCISYITSRWKYLALAALVLVNLVRVCAVQIGEKDIAELKQHAKQNPGDYAYFIDSKDIWHEYGLISSAIGRRVKLIYDANQIDSFLALGGTLILQDEQKKPEVLDMQCVEWHRLKRRMKFPVQKFLQQGISWANPELMRTYQLCSRAHQ